MLADLGVDLPVLAAPMAGGPTTPQMVIAAARAGSLGFLAAGYKSAEDVATQLRTVRASTEAFGVNLFVPNPVPVRPHEFRDYARRLQTDADEYGLDLGQAELREDEDEWRAKVDLLVHDPVPLVSFTFGLPDSDSIAALRRAGSVLMQTVTSAAEARAAADAGLDALAVQSPAAGGHSGTFTPEQPLQQRSIGELVREVRATVDLPVVAAGGIASAADVAEALRAGAMATAVGTLLLLSDESGSSATHQAALLAKRDEPTVLTRAFTGRPARAIRNTFVDRFSEVAPLGYPAVHHLTNPLRKAAAAAGDQERIHLWAGTGHAAVRRAPTAAILGELAAKA